MTDSFHLRSSRIRRQRAEENAEFAEELRHLSRQLSDIMSRAGGKSAMVRTYVDSKTGMPMCAFNLYGNHPAVGLYAANPLIEVREAVE